MGYRDITIAVDDGNERLLTAVWYPTGAQPGRFRLGPFTIPAVRDAPVARGRFGLILLSHGTGGGRLNHRDTAGLLARNGFIVAAPEHAGDSWRDDRRSGTWDNWRARPRQLSAVLDRLLSDPAFGARIDPARIGAVGHSAGGYSVLALIGGRPEAAALQHHCTARRASDPVFCSYRRSGGGGPADFPALHDRRVRVAVAVAPVGAIFGTGAFDGVRAPAQIHRLGQDDVVRRPWHAEHVARLMGDGATLVVHPRAHHFAFITPFPEALRADVGPPAQDPEDFDRAAFLADINGQILRFFQAQLPDG